MKRIPPPASPQPREVNIAIPVRGLVEGLTGPAQPEGFYATGVNMRSRTEESEHVGLGPRSGLVDFAGPLPEPARHLFPAVQETPPFLWRELSSTPQADVSPAVVTADWELELRGTPIAKVQGLDGTIYVLRLDGSVDVCNAEGKLVETVESPIPRGFSIVPRIQVDETGALYLAGAANVQQDGVTGRIARVRKRNGVWSAQWTVATLDPITDFAYTLNSIYALTEALPEEEENDQSPPQVAQLTRFSQVLSALPVLAWDRPAPRPAFQVIGLRDGSAVILSPHNRLRLDATTTSFTERGQGWTPREVANWQTRVHAWVDGVQPIGDGQVYNGGDPVRRLADARLFTSTLAPTTDATERELVADANGDFGAPTYEPTAFGGLGGPRFTGGAVLASGLNRDVTDRLLQEALIPGIDETFALFAVVQIDPEAMDGTSQYRVLTQASESAQLAIYITVQRSGADFNVQVSDLSGLRATGLVSVASNTFLLTILHGGSGGANGRFRINGTHTANLTFSSNAILSGGDWYLDPLTGPPAGTLLHPGPRTAIGAHRLAADHNFLTLATNLVRFGGPYGVTQNADRLRDGRIVAGESNRVVLTSGTQAFVLRVTFSASVPTLTGIAFFTSNIGSQARSIVVRAGSDATFATFLEDYEATFEQRELGAVFPARDYVDFGVQATYRYWEIEVLSVWGSGNDWGLTEVQFLRRAEQVEYNSSLAIGSIPILESAPMNFGASFVLMSPDDPGAVNGTGPVGSLPAAVTDVEAIEGYFAHRFGISHQLPVDHPYVGPGNFPLGIGDTRSDNQAESLLSSPLPIVARISASGKALWAFVGAGVGYAAAEGENGALVTMGPAFPSTGDALTTNGWGAWLRRFYMTNDELDDAHASAWEQLAAVPGEELETRAYRPALDLNNDVYLVRSTVDNDVTVERRQGEDGAVIYSEAIPGTGRILEFSPDGFDLLRNPGDAVTVGPRRAIFLREHDEDGLQALIIMGQERSGATSPRELLTMAICGDSLVKVSDAGVQTVLGTGLFGDDELWTARLYGKVFIGAASGYKVFDEEFGTVRSFQGSTKGRFPQRCRLGAAWNGRLWLALGDNSREWYMSRIGDPFDMDFQPEVIDEGMAVSSPTSPIEAFPDTPRCLMPWSAQVAYVGCETSIYRFEGDPASDGRLVLVSPKVGVAFGQESYTTDDTGTIYFWAAHGDVCAIRVGSPLPVSIAHGRVGARMKDVDLRIWRPRLVWNLVDGALHCFMAPRPSNPYQETTLHFVWQKEADAWHMDQFTGGTGRAIVSAMSYDGDLGGDRTMILAGADGMLRKWDRYSEDDAGHPRPWSVTMGPVRQGALAGTAKMVSLHVSSIGRGRFFLAPWGSDVAPPDARPDPLEHHEMEAGQSGGVSARASGSLLYVTAYGQDRVTLTAMTAGIVPAGRTKR